MTDNPFPCESETPNAVTAAAMQEARQGDLPTFKGVFDLLADLNSEDSGIR
jgi:hypothetical protein